ncbi:MAG: hypothetical protein IJF58_04790 [Clostridia bacterium]|nr:hypothetical protein [Clostridia bacterium]
MNQVNQTKEMQFKKTIFGLSLVSLVFVILTLSKYFLGLNSFQGTIYPRFHITDIFSVIFNFAPHALWLIYIIKFRGETKESFMLPILFGLIGFKPFLTLPLYFQNDDVKLVFSFGTVISFVVGILFILAAVDALKGFNNKFYLTIAAAIQLLVTLCAIVVWSFSAKYYIENKIWFLLLPSIAQNLSNFALYGAMFLFGLKNILPIIFASKKASTDFAENKPNI